MQEQGEDASISTQYESEVKKLRVTDDRSIFFLKFKLFKLESKEAKEGKDKTGGLGGLKKTVILK
jgi:hypothetical protein